MLEEPIKEGVAPKMKGSVLMCVADTEEEVLERVKKDVYYTADVWDKEKVSARCFGFGGRMSEIHFGTGSAWNERMKEGIVEGCRGDVLLTF